MASHSGVVALGAPMALARGQGGVFRRNKRMGNYPSRFGASDSARILLPDRHCRRPIRVVPKATPGDDEGLSDDVTIKASINESSKMSLETELIEEIETTTTTSETVTTIVEDGVVVSTDILSNSDFDVSEGTVWKKKSEASMGSTSSSITSSVSSSKNGNAFGKTLTGFAKQAPELDENAIEKVSGAVAVGSASVVAVAFGSVAVGVTQALESVPILESFEQAVGLAVSAYYANKMSDNFLTATGREQFRLKLVENFTKVTGTESPVALAGKLARSDKELDAQIKGLIGELTVGTEENEKVLPEAVQNAISTFIRNRDGSVLSEIDSLRSVNENMRQQVDAIEMLQNELLEAKRETADARKNIKVMNLDEKEREKLESELRKARAEGEAMAEALRKEMADMAAKAATAAVAAEQALLREREQRQALETGEAVPPEGDVDFESSEQLDSAAKEKLARSAREIADFKEKLAKSKEWSDGVISGVDMNNEKDLQKALREAELRRERDLENAVRDSCDLVLEERRKAQALVKETEAYALEEITLAVRQARLEAKHSIEANKVETEEQFAEELAAKLSEATSAVAAELAARESELKTAKEEVDETKKQLLEAQRAASVSAQETELRVTNAVAAADAAAAALFEQKLATVTSELEAAAKEKLKATMADSLQELSLARAEANELRTQLDAISELASAKLANAMATAERALAEETKRANDAIAELKKMSKSSNETSSEMETRLEAELAEAKLATKKALEDMERFAAEAEAAKADAAEARRVSILAESKAKQLEEQSRASRNEGAYSREEVLAMEKAVADARKSADEAAASTAQAKADLATAKQSAEVYSAKVDELRVDAVETSKVIEGLKQISETGMENLRLENKKELERVLNVADLENKKRVQEAVSGKVRDLEAFKKESADVLKRAVAAAKADAETQLAKAVADADTKIVAAESKKRTELETKLAAAAAEMERRLSRAQADVETEREVATSARQDADRFSQKVSSLEQSLKDAELKLELADRTAIKAKNDVQDVSQRIETATKELSTKLTFTEQRLVNAQDAASRASESAEIFKTQLEKAEKEIANAAMNKTTSANDASLISDLSRKVATLEMALLAAGAATARAEAEVNDAKSAVAETQNDTVAEEINALKLELALAQQRATDAERAADLLAEKLAAGGGSDAASDTPSGSSGGKALFDFSGVNVGGINLSYDDNESNTYALNIDTSKLSALTKMKKPALVEELNARRLPVTGIVAELRQRLRDARQEDKTSRSSTSKTSKNVGANESALKRPLSSYMLFAKEMRGDVLHASPGLSVGEVGKELGARWKSLSVGAKAEWELKSKELKTRYEVELSEARTKDALIESTTTSTTTSTSTSATSTKGTSYYQVINGNRYDRKVLDDCRAAMNNDDEIDLDEAKTILKDVYDGPVKMQKRGVMSSVTDVELATLRYAHYAFNWTTEADTFMFEELYDKMLGLVGVADVEETPASGSNYSKKSQTDRYYQTVEDGTRVDTTVLKQVEGKEVGLAEAKKIFENIQDSKKRTEQRGVGVKSKVTKVELQTIKYASVKFNWSAEAKAFVEGEIGGAVEGDMTIEEV